MPDKGYVGSVEFSDEDGVFFGMFQKLNFIATT